MFLVLAIALAVTFVAALVSLLFVSIGRAASLVDNPATDLVLRRKSAPRRPRRV